MMMEECEGALNNFDSTRLKLQQILRRHEKIDAILQDVQQRMVPIHFLLSITDEQNMLNISEREKADKLAALDCPEEGLDVMAMGNLNSPYAELKTLRYNMNELNEGEDAVENVPSGDWKKMLKDLDDWYIRMDPTESVESITSGNVEMDRDAHVFDT
ncbi:hypothetical protein KR093_009254 [Drosophila rubida]|uniref:Uncharacterized protein n=1 Tax=Drosophila rubida TaxID=30044 RepID=A0AAD4PM51_9MUSC|nr:hypothetical protein KR093_009254 [Drosophila rubida]